MREQDVGMGASFELPKRTIQVLPTMSAVHDTSAASAKCISQNDWVTLLGTQSTLCTPIASISGYQNACSVTLNTIDSDMIALYRGHVAPLFADQQFVCVGPLNIESIHLGVLYSGCLEYDMGGKLFAGEPSGTSLRAMRNSSEQIPRQSDTFFCVVRGVTDVAANVCFKFFESARVVCRLKHKKVAKEVPILWVI